MSIQRYVKASVICVAGLISYKAAAQIVMTTPYVKQANIKVYVTEYKADADLVVFRTPFMENSYGNKGMWYYTRNAGEANKKIYYMKHKEEADLKVYFTTNEKEAGWQNKKKTYLFR